MMIEKTEPKGIDTKKLGEAIVIMLVSAMLFAVTFTFDHVPEILAQGIQPTVFPRAVLAILFGLAALQAYKSLNLSENEVSELKPIGPVPKIVLITSGCLIAFFVAIPIIGTFPTLIIFCPTLAFIWGERRWRLMVISFSTFVAFIYLLFRVVMNVPLP